MTRADQSHAFALPLVIMLTLVAGLTIAVMLERQTTQTMSVMRQIDGYQTHHTELGVRNLVDGWLKSISQKSLENVTADEQHILDITSGGTTYSIYISDAQGTVLLGFEGLEGQQLSRARMIARAYRPADPDSDQGREVGPVEISMRAASPEAIRAVAMSVLNDEGMADDFADRLISLRNRDNLTDGSVAATAAELGIDNDARASLQSLITLSPKLFSIRTVRNGSNDEPEEEFFGLAQFRSGQQGVGQRISKDSEFLSWRAGEPIDDE